MKNIGMMQNVKPVLGLRKYTKEEATTQSTCVIDEFNTEETKENLVNINTKKTLNATPRVIPSPRPYINKLGGVK